MSGNDRPKWGEKTRSGAATNLRLTAEHKRRLLELAALTRNTQTRVIEDLIDEKYDAEMKKAAEA